MLAKTSARFATATPLLQIQMVTFLLVTVDVILMMLCRASGFQRADLRLVVTTAIVNLVLNAILIPRFEAVGAALAAGLCLLPALTLRWRLVARSIIRLGWGSLIGPPLAVTAAVIPIALAFNEWLPWPVIALGYVVGYGAIAAVALPFLRKAIRAALRQRKAATG